MDWVIMHEHVPCSIFSACGEFNNYLPLSVYYRLSCHQVSMWGRGYCDPREVGVQNVRWSLPHPQTVASQTGLGHLHTQKSGKEGHAP